MTDRPFSSSPPSSFRFSVFSQGQRNHPVEGLPPSFPLARIFAQLSSQRLTIHFLFLLAHSQVYETSPCGYYASTCDIGTTVSPISVWVTLPSYALPGKYSRT